VTPLIAFAIGENQLTLPAAESLSSTHRIRNTLVEPGSPAEFRDQGLLPNFFQFYHDFTWFTYAESAASDDFRVGKGVPTQFVTFSYCFPAISEE